jgi:hypothetical protein
MVECDPRRFNEDLLQKDWTLFRQDAGRFRQAGSGARREDVFH